jgi:glycosyltransferase involved in cell wall biosynthesis
VPFEIVNFDVDIQQRQRDRSLSAHLVQTPNRRTNVFCVNADMIGSTMRAMGGSATSGRYNIVRPFWELPRIHPDWLKALSQIDEVWAPTHFVKEAFVASGIERVVHVPVAVDIPSDILPRRVHFGIPADATVYLFAFDFSSYPSRKNPQAVLDAYRLAFGADVGAPVVLVIKTMGQSPLKPKILAEIAELARKDPRIIVIDEVLTRQEMHALTASCDVFVSLHRSEGFGLGIAEAMAMGKAVVATDFSGSVDFVSAETGCPVPYRLIEVKPGDYPYYIEGQIWADPDIDASAEIMRSLFENPALRLEIGARARQFMTQVHSPAAVGAIVAARLVELGQE